MRIMTIQSLRWAALAVGLVLTVPAGAAESDPEFSLNGESLMWRLDPPGGGAPSYVVGTMHLVDERLDPAVARAIGRLEEAGALAVEIDIDDDVAQRMGERMHLPPGRDLAAMIGPDRFASLAAIAAEYGMPAEALVQVAPWAAAMMIGIPADQLEATAAGAPELDQQLVDAAVVRGLPVASLETIDEQIDAFAAGPEADQVVFLAHMIEGHAGLARRYAEMLDRYVADDLAGLMALGLAGIDTGDPEVTARLVEAVLLVRNRRMAARMVPLLEAQPHLVAVGAMHLPGREGVLELMRNRGWTVTRAP
jgi:uncharacterized protein